MKRVLFHGTDAESYNAIKKNGFCSTEAVWTCSDDSYIYFYDLQKIKDCNNLDTDEEAEQMAISRAFESAQIAAAKKNSQSAQLYVLKIVLDDESCEILDDESCENMSEAVCVDEDELQNITFESFCCEDGYSPALRLFVLRGVLDRQYFDSYGIFTAKELQIINSINSCYIDDLITFDWE